MTSPTESFFDELSRRGRIPMLATADGSIRFELIDGRTTDRWLLDVHRGHVRVSRADAEADCVVRTDRTLFDRVVLGEVNAMAAMLRGELMVEGDPRLLVLAQRLFPDPPAARTPEPVAADGRLR
jgi:putative sterol carrier protein